MPLEDFPELAGWLAQTDLRARLLDETGGGEAFIAAAAATLQNALIGAMLTPADKPPKTPLRRWLKRGYSPEDIARAVAEAWLHEAAVAYLPKQSLTQSNWLLYGVPLVLVTAVLVPVVTFQFRQHPQLAMASIYAGSFLVIPLIPLVWLVMKLWRWLLRGTDTLTHRGSAAVVSIPQAELALRGEIRLDSDNNAIAQALTPLASKPEQPTSERTPMMSELEIPTVTIDGKEYPADQLPEDARMQMANVQVCDQEIARLQTLLAITQTARNAYANALREILDGKAPRA